MHINVPFGLPMVTVAAGAEVSTERAPCQFERIRLHRLSIAGDHAGDVEVTAILVNGKPVADAPTGKLAGFTHLPKPLDLVKGDVLKLTYKNTGNASTRVTTSFTGRRPYEYELQATQE